MKGRVAVLAACVAGCAAATSFTVTPPAQAPVCQRGTAETAVVVWGTKWRSNQKDVAEREAAAHDGLRRFLLDSGCFAASELRRLASSSDADVEAAVAAATQAARPDVVVVVVVRELGPIVKLLSSAALVEGGTEVVLDIAEHRPKGGSVPRAFSVHWQNGGPGVIKGVASLPADMEAALFAGLQPSAGR